MPQTRRTSMNQSFPGLRKVFARAGSFPYLTYLTHLTYLTFIAALLRSASLFLAVLSFGLSPTRCVAAGKTVLFMDWANVDKGNWQPVYDTNRLTKVALKQFADMKRDFSIEQRLGKHGMVPFHVPSGVRITIEKAKKSERWLRPDTAWEKHIQGATVIYEQGKYRCWYPIALKNVVRESVFDKERQMEITGGAFCYAESTDGMH